jgi:hypothetical protein
MQLKSQGPEPEPEPEPEGRRDQGHRAVVLPWLPNILGPGAGTFLW